MNHLDFESIVERRMSGCREVLCAKGDEYSRGGDRLWNFKVAACKLACTPGEALRGMKVKHDVSVDDMVADLAAGKVPSVENVAEKIGDSINYLLLLEGLIEEARAAQIDGGASKHLATGTTVKELGLALNCLGNLCRRGDAQ